MKWWRRLNDWLSWRGVTWNDISYAIFALATLGALITLLTGIILQ